MKLDDIGKLATGSVLFSLDRVIVPRLLSFVYLLGLAAIALWGLDHLFDTFRFGFGAGLWGLLEVIVFGLLAFVVLRAICEMVLIFYKANEHVAAQAMNNGHAASLIDDVAGALEDLAEEEDRAPVTPGPPVPPKRPVAATRASASSKSSAASRKPAASKAAPSSSAKSSASKPRASGSAAKRVTARRTARRTPRPKSS